MAELSGSDALDLEALYTRVRARVRAGTGVADLAFPDLDAACRALLARARLPSLNPAPRTGQPRADALYVATEIYPAGGHRLLLEQMIACRPSDRHTVAFTGLLGSTLEFSRRRMLEINAGVFSPDPVDTLWDKWLALRAHIASIGAARIIFLHHSEDVIAALLAQEMEAFYGENLVFVRHADTVGSLGADLTRATHLAIRPEQAAMLKASWPDLKIHQVPLCYDRDMSPPRLGAEPSRKFERRNAPSSRLIRLRRSGYERLRRVVWGLRRARFSILRLHADRLDVPARLSGPIITATCGTEHKFELEGDLALPKVIVALLKSGVRHHIHIGPASPRLREACHLALHEAGLARRRLRFAGEVPSVADVLLCSRVTLFLGSFPVGGALSRAEAAWAGIPIAILDPAGASGRDPYLCGADFAPDQSLIWTNTRNLSEQLQADGIEARLQSLGVSARSWFETVLSPARFADAMNALVEKLPPANSISHSCERKPDSATALALCQGITPAAPAEWVQETRQIRFAPGADQRQSQVLAAHRFRVARPRVVSLGHIAQTGQIWELPAVEAACWPEAIALAGADGFVTCDGDWYDPGLAGVDPAKISLRYPGPVEDLSEGHVKLRRGATSGAVETGLLATGCYSHNYFHFLLEVLPRAMQAAALAPRGTPVLTEDDLPPQCYQALRTALPENPLCLLRRGQSVGVGRLFASGMGTLVNDLSRPCAAPPVSALRYHPGSIRQLRALSAIGTDGDGPEKLFLERRSSKRRLRNSAEIRDLMRSSGFEVTDPAELAFAEQVRLMGGARSIVAQSGAHLANMLFARPGCRVIVLFSDVTGINYRLWSALGQILGHEVINIAGPHVSETSDIHADFSVPSDMIRPLLDGPGFVPRDLFRVLDLLYGLNASADVLTGSWAVVAGGTPAGFEARLRVLRARAISGLRAVPASDLGALLAHSFFADYGRNLRSGLLAFAERDLRGEPARAAQADAAALRAALCALAEGGAAPAGGDAAGLEADGTGHEAIWGTDSADDAARRLLMLGMLSLPNWEVPLPRDPGRLPGDVLERWCGWAGTPPVLARAGEDAAWVAHVARLLDWVADGLDATRGAVRGADAALRARLVRFVAGLDLGQLLLVDVPLNAVQAARNRVLEHVALRGGTPRHHVRPAVAGSGPGRRQRIGLLCRTFEKGPDSEAVVAFFEGFDRERYEIHAYSVGFRDRVVSRDPDFDARFDAAIAHRRTLPGDPAGIRARILADELDVFLYANATTYGIQPLDLALYHRVAPVQAVLNSHLPMAMGYPSFDAVITGLSDDPAQEVSQDQHPEVLIRCPGPVISYLTSFAPRKTPVLDRAALGLSETDIVLMNAGSSMKLRHETLSAMMRAVVDVPGAKLLLAPYNPGWAARSMAFSFNVQVARTAAEVGLAMERIVILGELSVAEAEAALSCADVYLNPFPHGGATMTHLALINGVPPVTLRRRSTRSIDQFLIGALGFDSLLASSVDAYVQRAQTLARDPEQRADLARQLKNAARNPVFVNSKTHSRNMQKAVRKIINLKGRDA